jgi:hypothetical protein
LTTEQLIILGFLALAFFAGWVARALVGGARHARGREPMAVANEPEPLPVGATSEPEPSPVATSEPEPVTVVSTGPEPIKASSDPERVQVASGPRPVPATAASEPEPVPAAQSFEVAVHQSRDELGRAIRAYHSAVVRTLRNGSGRDSGQESLEVLSGALVALSRAVDHESRTLKAENPLTGRLQRTGGELRRLADDVLRHSRERELPAGVFDQLEQHLISAASMILTPSRLQPEPA